MLQLKNKMWKTTLVLLLLSLGSQGANSQKTRSRSTVLESVSTRAGVLTLVRTDDYEIGDWFVLLAGKRIYRTHDDVFGSVSFHTLFKSFASGEVILLQEIIGPDICRFRIIDIPSKGKPSVSDQFGFCEPLITQDAKQIVFSFAGKPGAKPDTWIYQNGTLIRQ